jgi:hypothetical protein
VVISDWITGLSMHSYVRRRFVRDAVEELAVERRVRALHRVVASYLDAGKIGLAWRPGPLQLDLSLTGWLDARFFARAAPRLEKLLRDTQSTLTLRIEELQSHQVAHLQRLLARLARHGDRVSVIVHEKLRALVAVDSSVFNLVL